MFEQPCLRDRRTTVWVDDRESRLADINGVTIPSGMVPITFDQVVTLVGQLDHRIDGGLTYRRDEKRLRALRNTLLWAFGPEGEEEYALICQNQKQEG
jgi:hypothetical protein